MQNLKVTNPLDVEWKIKHDDDTNRFRVGFPETIDNQIVDEPPKYVKIQAGSKEVILYSTKPWGDGDTLLVSKDSGLDDGDRVYSLQVATAVQFGLFRARHSPSRFLPAIGGILVLLGLIFSGISDTGQLLFLRVEDVVFWNITAYVCEGFGAVLALLGAILPDD